MGGLWLSPHQVSLPYKRLIIHYFHCAILPTRYTQQFIIKGRENLGKKIDITKQVICEEHLVEVIVGTEGRLPYEGG